MIKITCFCVYNSFMLYLSPDMANLSLNDNDGSSGASDQDTLAPLPLPGASPWPMMHTFPYQPYPTHPYSSQPPPYHELTSYSYAPGSTGSQHSEGEHGYHHVSFKSEDSMDQFWCCCNGGSACLLQPKTNQVGEKTKSKNVMKRFLSALRESKQRLHEK